MIPKRPYPDPSLAQALSLLLIAFLLMLVIGTLVLMLLNGSDQESISGNKMALAIFISMATSYSLLAFISKPYWLQRFLPQLKFQSSWLLVSLLLGSASAILVLQLQTNFPSPNPLETNISTALDGDSWALILVYFSVIFLAPFFEEYLFRGILFESLLRQWGLTSAVLLSSFVFTLFHLFEYHQYWLAWFTVFCLALMLAIVRHKSQSMLNPILLHAAYNATLLIAGSN